MKFIFTLIATAICSTGLTQMNWSGKYEMEIQSEKNPYQYFKMGVTAKNLNYYDIEILITSPEIEKTIHAYGVRQKDNSLSIYFNWSNDRQDKTPSKTKIMSLTTSNGVLMTTFYYPKKTKPLIRYRKVEKFSY